MSYFNSLSVAANNIGNVSKMLNNVIYLAEKQVVDAKKIKQTTRKILDNAENLQKNVAMFKI